MTQAKKKIDIDQDIQDLIPQFMENRKLDFIALDKLLIQNDYDQIARLAHKIKGTAGGYGFAELSNYASEIEDYAKHQDRASLLDVAVKMKDHFNNIEVQFVKMY